MGAHPTSSQCSKISKRARAANTKRHKCPQPCCDTWCSRPSDLTRHLRDQHGLGFGSVWRCSVLGCTAKYNRSDKFKAHVKKAHPLEDLDCVVRESTTPIGDAVHTSVFDDGTSCRSDCDTEAFHHRPAFHAGQTHAADGYSGQRYSLDQDHLIEASTALSPSTTRLSQLTRLAAPTTGNHNQSHDACSKTSSTAYAALSSTLVELFHRLEAQRLVGHHCAEVLSDAGHVVHTTEHDSCGCPSDANEGHVHQAHGSFQGLLPPGRGGLGNGNGTGKGKERARDDDDNEEDFPPSDSESKGVSEDPLRGLPCVYCFGPTNRMTPTCRRRKAYICNLWPHHYRHNFFCCWVCFTWFESRQAMEQHRSANSCTAVCLDQNCRNFNGTPTGHRPCQHNSHTRQVVIWQRLYREAHGLTTADWVPDPTHRLHQQSVPDNLPASHPMYSLSRQTLVQAVAPVSHHQGIPGPQYPPNLLADVGGGIGMVPPHEAIQVPDDPGSDQDMLRHVLRSALTVLWGRLNRRVPSWTDEARGSFRIVPPLDPRHIYGQHPDTIPRTRHLHFLVFQYAALIDGNIRRRPGSWVPVRELTRRLLGDLVVVPEECPWDLDEETPDMPHHVPRLFPATVADATIDPTLDQPGHAPWFAFNDVNGMVSSTGRDSPYIPQASTNPNPNNRWQVDLDQASHRLSPHTPRPRGPSFGSMTSRSDVPYHSAQSSFSHDPWNRSFASSSQQHQYQGPSNTQSDFSDLLRDPDEIEDEDGDGEQMDLEGLD